MNINEELKRPFIPKKLWILRLYVSLLTFLAEALLTLYIVFSIYNLITSESVFGNLVLGFSGFYLVWLCIILLFITQIVMLFLNIHDNIEDVRNKTVDPNFFVNIEDDKEKNQSKSIAANYTIILVTLSIIFSFVNLNRASTSVWSSTTNSSDLVNEEQSEFIEEFQNAKNGKSGGGFWDQKAKKSAEESGIQDEETSSMESKSMESKSNKSESIKDAGVRRQVH